MDSSRKSVVSGPASLGLVFIGGGGSALCGIGARIRCRPFCADKIAEERSKIGNEDVVWGVSPRLLVLCGEQI